MPSPWVAVDGLMRELRTLRDDARALDPALANTVVAEVETLIERATQAVDQTINYPEDEALRAGASQSIVEAYERIQRLNLVPTRVADIMTGACGCGERRVTLDSKQLRRLAHL
jgi:hypothetical protein